MLAACAPTAAGSTCSLRARRLRRRPVPAPCSGRPARRGSACASTPTSSGRARRAARRRAGRASVDHCTYLTDADVDALAASDTVATFLPATDFSTRQPYPDARAIDAGVPRAIATNCNPGSSYTTSMAFCIALAVRDLRMTAEEALRAATLGGADGAAPRRRRRLAPGARADACLLDAASYTHLVYRPGARRRGGGGGGARRRRGGPHRGAGGGGAGARRRLRKADAGLGKGERGGGRLPDALCVAIRPRLRETVETHVTLGRRPDEGESPSDRPLPQCQSQPATIRAAGARRQAGIRPWSPARTSPRRSIRIPTRTAPRNEATARVTRTLRMPSRLQ